jgi:hypothetical protein
MPFRAVITPKTALRVRSAPEPDSDPEDDDFARRGASSPVQESDCHLWELPYDEHTPLQVSDDLIQTHRSTIGLTLPAPVPNQPLQVFDIDQLMGIPPHPPHLDTMAPVGALATPFSSSDPFALPGPFPSPDPFALPNHFALPDPFALPNPFPFSGPSTSLPPLLECQDPYGISSSPLSYTTGNAHLQSPTPFLQPDNVWNYSYAGVSAYHACHLFCDCSDESLGEGWNPHFRSSFQTTA